MIGRYTGNGHTADQADRQVGKETKEFVYELTFPAKTASDTGKDFVEHLWARRKVGYLLDQIRVNGEKKELIDEVVALAKKYGITTPYTSYLVVPDAPMPVAQAESTPGQPKRDADKPVPIGAAPLAGGGVGGFGGVGGARRRLPPGLASGGPGEPADGRREAFSPANAGRRASDSAAIAAR